MKITAELISYEHMNLLGHGNYDDEGCDCIQYLNTTLFFTDKEFVEVVEDNNKIIYGVLIKYVGKTRKNPEFNSVFLFLIYNVKEEISETKQVWFDLPMADEELYQMLKFDVSVFLKVLENFNRTKARNNDKENIIWENYIVVDTSLL